MEAQWEDRDAISTHLRSLLWMTYRKGFTPIGSRHGPKSDAGWGCMHRCGQMILAEAMSRVHLGSAWRWQPKIQNPNYFRILRMFQDRRSSLYSIQTITLTGVGVGKPIESWFGPNTVSQVLKKLSVYDRWTNLVIHISVEDGVIVDEIKSLCRHIRPRLGCDLPNVPTVTPTGDADMILNLEPQSTTDRKSNEDEGSWSDSSSSSSFTCPFRLAFEPNPNEDWNDDALKVRQRIDSDVELVDLRPQLHFPVTRELDSDCVEIVLPPIFENAHSSSDSGDQSQTEALIGSKMETTVKPQSDNDEDTREKREIGHENDKNKDIWRPLLLFVPLRLGLHNPNPCYFEALKALFRIPQCIGILGGRPSHAVWIVGVVDDEIICLDPHTTQLASRSVLDEAGDESFHCDSPIRMPLNRLDPSIVLGFICRTEKDFDDLCQALKQDIVTLSPKGTWPLLEIHQTRPANLPPLPTNSSTMLMSVFPLDNGNKDQDQSSSKDTEEAPSQSNLDGLESGLLQGSMDAVRNILSKCNRVVGEKVRDLVNMPQQLIKGSDYEVI